MMMTRPKCLQARACACVSYIEVIVIGRMTNSCIIADVDLAFFHSWRAYRKVEANADCEALGMNVTWLYEPKHYQDEKEREKDTEKCEPIQMEAEEKTLATETRRR